MRCKHEWTDIYRDEMMGNGIITAVWLEQRCYLCRQVRKFICISGVHHRIVYMDDNGHIIRSVGKLGIARRPRYKQTRRCTKTAYDTLLRHNIERCTVYDVSIICNLTVWEAHNLLHKMEHEGKVVLLQPNTKRVEAVYGIMNKQKKEAGD